MLLLIFNKTHETVLLLALTSYMSYVKFITAFKTE